MKDGIYSYFISYTFQNAFGFGFGNSTAKLNRKIKNIHDIGEVERMLETENNLKEKSLIILNYREF